MKKKTKRTWIIIVAAFIAIGCALIALLVIKDDKMEQNSNIPDNEMEIEQTDNNGTREKFELSEAGEEFLADMCFYLPDFHDSSEFTEEFWHDFIFLSYTGAYGDGVEIVEVERKDLGFAEHQVKVSKEEVEAYVKLALGIDMPSYEPSFESMNPGETACYYQEGYYYIGVSDFPDYRYEYKNNMLWEDNRFKVEYTISFQDEENVGSVFFLLSKAQNDNGFILEGKSTEFLTTD